MERIAIAGLSLNEVDVVDLEALRAGPDASNGNGEFLRELADRLGASELVHLATCNRVEVVFAREVGHRPSNADARLIAEALCGHSDAPIDLRIATGRDAVHHLFRVVSSLDSLVQGEDQILAQTREAYSSSEKLALTGSILDPVFEHAFQIGKQVRTRTDLSRNPISVMSLGVSLLAERLSENEKARIALIGAGDTARHAARSLTQHGLKVAYAVNRTVERAESLAGELGVRAMSLAAFQEGAASGAIAVDAVVSATSAPGVVLDAVTLGRLAAHTPSTKRFVGLDLALPRDLEPTDDPRIEIIDLEALRASAERNRGLRAAAAAQAETMIENKLEAFARHDAERRAAELIESFMSDSAEVLERQLAELAKTGLDEADRRSVERWARSTFGRLTYLPVAACKKLASEAAAPIEIEEGETTG